MAEKTADEVAAAQRAYKQKQVAKKKKEKRILVTAIVFCLGLVGGGLYFVVMGGGGSDDCKNPKNKNTPYCQEQGQKAKRDWKSLSSGGSGGFSLSGN